MAGFFWRRRGTGNWRLASLCDGRLFRSSGTDCNAGKCGNRSVEMRNMRGVAWSRNLGEFAVWPQCAGRARRPSHMELKLSVTTVKIGKLGPRGSLKNEGLETNFRSTLLRVTISKHSCV